MFLLNMKLRMMKIISATIKGHISRNREMASNSVINSLRVQIVLDFPGSEI